MVTYCHTQSIRHSLLIYADPEPVDYRGNFRGIFVEAASLPLAGNLAQLRDQCHRLVAQITARCDALRRQHKA
jgi:hypothetical protein